MRTNLSTYYLVPASIFARNLQEPSYMSANPGYYLYTTLDSCCTSNFGWNYFTCMGELPGICSRALYYPDFEGTNTGCVNDGNEPTYMRNTPVNYLFSQLADCCAEHYQWNYQVRFDSSLSAWLETLYKSSNLLVFLMCRNVPTAPVPQTGTSTIQIGRVQQTHAVRVAATPII